MNSPYRLVIFDWDGTLMDSETKICRCFEKSAADVGIPYPGDEAVRNIIGLGLREAMSILFPNGRPEQETQLLERYREHFVHLDDTAMELFPGVRDGLQTLADNSLTLAVATGKARRGLDRVLHSSALGHLFAATRCADEAGSKPDPRMLHDILAATDIDPADAVMVGDTTYDLRMANAAGVDSLAVSYGAHEKGRLLQEGPLACLDSFNQVCAWLR